MSLYRLNCKNQYMLLHMNRNMYPSTFQYNEKNNR